MRYAILSDIHGNLPALQAVLQESRSLSADKYVCLGDIVGYGAQPRECLEIIQGLSEKTVAGNHDFAALGKIDIDNFNEHAKESTLWTRRNLREEDLDYLRNLPLVQHLNGFSIVHGTLYSPELFDYIQTSYDAFLSLSQMPGDVCFLGHSHIPVSFIQRRFITYSFAPEFTVEPGTKVLVNVGSVGQPRDHNPHASFALFDTEARKVSVRRVPYDVAAAAASIREAGLPEILGERLKVGR